MKKLFYLILLISFFLPLKSYAEYMCSSWSSTADSGTIYDSGGAGGNYSNSENCGFLIQPSSSPSNITLNFSDLYIEPYYTQIWDYLEVYDGSNSSGVLLGRFYGYYPPNSVSVTATSGSMYLSFFSDPYLGEYPGFTGSWASTTPEAVLIASYNFDDDWITNNSLIDQTGSYNGSPDGSISRVLAGASSPKGDTCYAGSFSGGDIDITGLPVSTATGAKTSVSFWMYWDGTNNVMPMGWYRHALWLVSGYFGFNTLGNDVTGISSSGLSSGWHHVAAIFTNGSVSNNKLYIDGDLKTISYKTGTLNTANAIVQSALRIGGILFYSSYKFRGMIDNFKIYTGEISQAQVTADMNESNACPSGGGTSCVTFRDEFSTESYSRQDGTANWSTNWNEVSDNGSASTGYIEISSNKLQLEAEGFGSTTLGGPYIEREADLSSYTTATLSFDYSATEDWGDEENDEVKIYTSSNGGSTWTLIHTFTGTQSQSTQQFSQDISAYIANNTRIALVEKGIEDDERFYFDNVQIEACAVSGGGDTPATNFNCVENGINGITGNLYTKTITQSFNFDIVALQDASTIETSFASGTDHTVTVELVNAETAASCDSYPALTPAISQSLNMTAADAGTKTSAYMTSNTAYRNLKCRVTDATNSPSVVGCSTDSFAIRPTGMTILSNLTNANATGTPKAKAGENFTLTTTATTGYNGTPSINNSNLQAHVGAIQTGSISGSFNAADSTTGIASGSAFIYSEVGSLRFSPQGIYDDNFTAVDQPNDCTNDFSNTKVSGKIGCKFSNTTPSDYFGRFTPDHFDVALNTPVFDPSCSTFTYLDQPIKYTVNPIVTLLAKNSSGDTTQNYTGDYWKINPSGFIPVYVGSSHPLLTLDSTPPIETDLGDGTGLLTFADTTRDILQITKGTLTAPFDAEIALRFSLTDSDTIAVANVDGVAQVNPVTFGASSVGNGISFNNSKNHRWGRVSLGNTHGSELTPLSVPLYTEYFNGTHFIKNTADNCTTFSLATNFSISDTVDFDCSFATQTTPVAIGSGSVKASFLTNMLIAGGSELIISDNSVTSKGAGAGNTGHVDITSKLTNLPWLLYDWDGDTVNDNCPTARATFGIYKGNEKQIYFREVY